MCEKAESEENNVILYYVFKPYGFPLPEPPSPSSIDYPPPPPTPSKTPSPAPFLVHNAPGANISFNKRRRHILTISQF